MENTQRKTRTMVGSSTRNGTTVSKISGASVSVGWHRILAVSEDVTSEAGGRGERCGASEVLDGEGVITRKSGLPKQENRKQQQNPYNLQYQQKVCAGE